MSHRSEMLRDQRLQLYADQACCCAACGQPLAFGEAELAHRIPETVSAIEKYGRAVVDHPMNKGMTHKACNIVLNIQGYPLECDALAERIRKAIHGM